jgi:hypothetical protein
MTTSRAAFEPDGVRSVESARIARLSRVFSHGLRLVPIVALELRQATAAAHRFQELKCAASGRSNPATEAARQVFTEFYADR